MGKLSPLNNYFLPGSFHSGEFSVVSSWLIRLRWASVGGFFLLTVFLSYFFPSVLPLQMLYIVCLIILFYNLAFFIYLKAKIKIPRWTSLFITRLQVLLDWLALLAIIHLTGGVFSPLVFFFILHIIINSMVFPPRQCFIYTALSLTGLGLLFFMENYFSEFSTTTSWLGTSFQYLNPTSMLLAFLIYTFILFTATFLATSIMARFRQRENDIRLLSLRLQDALTRMETLYEATKTMVSSYDINTVLDIIVRESARIMKAKGAALHLVKEGREELTSPVSFGLSETFFRKGPVKRSEGLFPQNPDDVIMVEDVKTDPRIVYPKEAADEAISSIISIPLVHKGEVTGDLRLYSENPRQYSRDEISFLKVLAGGAAVVIEDVRTWKRLKERNQKTIFYANKMSHDLRAPVYAVQSLLSAMEKGYAGEITSRQKEILNRCINKQGQLLQLIKDILILAEEQAPVHEQKPVSTCLDAVAGDTLNLLNVLFQQKQIVVEYTPPPEPISFREIPGDFQRLFSNLLENALRYTPEGGRVEVAVKRIAENISIIVKDTGIGIESEHIEKIFDEFYRTARAKKIVQDGTGLGLPTVKTIVERYNGFINVESRPDKGTTFFITLPDG